MTSPHNHLQDTYPATEEFGALLEQANVNPRTGFATNYVNHFIEILMCFEMLPEIPDCMDDIRAWQEMDYQTHVRQSGLKNAEVILSAYETADLADRQKMHQVSSDVTMHINHFREWAEDALEQKDDQALAEIAAAAREAIGPVIEHLNRLIIVGKN